MNNSGLALLRSREYPDEVPDTLTCPNCATEIRLGRQKAVASLAGAALARRRSPDQRLGPPKKMRKCRYCHKEMGTVETRQHEPHCQKNPTNLP